MRKTNLIPKFFRYGLLLCCLWAGKVTVNAQQHFPISIAIGNEATAIPFTRFFTVPVHPTFRVGTEYQYKSGPHYRFYQTANLGYIYHGNLYQGIFLNSEVAYDYRFNFGLRLKALFGIGYLHTFGTQEEYQLENGAYTPGPDKGNPRLMPSLSVGVGYDLRKGNPNSPEIYLLYKSWVEYPYSPGFIPVMTHTILELGIKINLKSSNNEDK